MSNLEEPPSGSGMRILWILNHETLRGAEVEYLIELGAEVFTPKVIPSSGFRSGDITYAYDSSLTIPPTELSTLNAFDFYGDFWTPEVVRICNQRFDLIMAMPIGRALPQALEHFRGPVVLRVFGTHAPMTYAKALTMEYGADILTLLAERADSFVFGQAYPNLASAEPEFFAARALDMPITLPRKTNTRLGSWTGELSRVAVLCPDIVDLYYAKWFLRFKEQMGDLPHTIVGSQHQAVVDSSVLGRVSWERLGRTLATSRVFLYLSREPRHVHYTPFEAAQMGSPIVFFDDSLFGDLCADVSVGRVRDWTEAREVVQHLLSGGPDAASAMAEHQRGIASALAWKSHLSAWESALQLLRSRGGRPTVEAGTSVDPYVVMRRQGVDHAARSLHSTERLCTKHFDARASSWPEWLAAVVGLDEAEIWGRWSIEPDVTFLLANETSGLVRVRVNCTPLAEHVGKSVHVEAGDASKSFTLRGDIGQYVVGLRPSEPIDRIVLRAPVTAELVEGQRRLGLAMRSIEFTAMTTSSRHGLEAEQVAGAKS